MKPSKILPAVIMAIACLVWSWTFRDFFNGSIPVNGDTNSNYLILKYFFNSVLEGTLPLWDPYTFLGRHFLYTFSSCALNPFAWTIPLGVILGLDYYQAYLFYITGYFFLGSLGFYYLVKLLLNEEWIGLLGFGLILTSGIGPVLFKQIMIVYLFVPAVWFFIFWVQFFRTYGVRDFWGMILCLMIMAVSYLPFYFLTFFLFYLGFSGVLFGREVLAKCAGVRTFVRQHWRSVGLGVCAVLMALTPLVLFKVMDSRGELVSVGRHNCPSKADARCVERAELRYQDVGLFGAAPERMMGVRAYSDLDKISYQSDDFFYVSVLCCFILLVAAFTPMCRFRILIFVLGVLIFLTSLGAVTPLHRFLYDHAVYFRFFRNLYFFSAFLIPLVIFFALAQLKAFCAESKGIGSSLWIVLSAAGLAGIFVWQGQVLIATYLSVLGAAALLLIVRWTTWRIHPLILYGFVFLLVMFEPWQVFALNISHIPSYACRLPREHAPFAFAFQRPLKDGLDICLPLYRKEIYSALRYMSFMKDASGFYTVDPDFVMSHVPEIADRGGRRPPDRGAEVKLSVYDQPARWLDQTDRFWDLREGRSVDEHTSDVRVERFTANQLTVRTEFSEDKYLLYRDAYSSDWRVFIDGRKAPLHRASIAFKGVVVPAGRHSVDFRYLPAGGVWIYWMIVVSMMLIAGGIGASMLTEKRTKRL